MMDICIGSTDTVKYQHVDTKFASDENKNLHEFHVEGQHNKLPPDS